MKDFEGLFFFLSIIIGFGSSILMFSSLFSKKRKKKHVKNINKTKNISFISFNVFLLSFNVFLLMLLPWVMYYPKSENQGVMLIFFCFLILIMMVMFLLIFVDKKEERKNGY